MVQLKPINGKFTVVSETDFNSMMVQLKLIKQTANEILMSDFNSMMVQLKLIDIYNGNLVFTEVSLRINVYFFRCKNVDV